MSLEGVKYEALFYRWRIAMPPKHFIRVLLIHMFCVKKYTGQCGTLMLHQNYVIAGKASTMKRSENRRHCQYRYCTYGLEAMCLAVMISSLTSLNPLDFSELVLTTLIHITHHGKTKLKQKK